jgi:hypothetical protein
VLATLADQGMGDVIAGSHGCTTHIVRCAIPAWENNQLKRALIAALVGVMAFGTFYGLAASLNVSSDSLGAGDVTVAACQAATLTATYTTSYSASTPGYTVGTVTVTGLAATCYSKAYKITLSGSAGASLGEATGTTPSSGTSFAATFSPAVSAASVAGIAVVVSG